MKNILLPTLISILVIMVVFLAFRDLEMHFQEVLVNLKASSSRYAIYSILILSSDIILPVPSSIIMYLNGSVLGLLPGFTVSYLSVMISVIIGFFLGSTFSYGGSKKMSKVSAELLEKYGFMAIVVSRGIPILSESICITCGYNRYSFRRYLIFNMIGYIPICLIYAIFGSIGASQNQFLLSFAFSILLSFMLWLFGKKYLKLI